MSSTISAVIILFFIVAQLACAQRPNYTPYNYGYNNYNNYPRYNNGYGNYNQYNSYNPYRTYGNNGYGNYNYYNSYYNGYNNNGYNNNYQYTPFGGTTAGGTYVGSPLARIWLTCNGIGCPARG